ncbi:sensor histidine kinase [Actinomadura parmotrematis]|uniref:sensor histidine kinase n=1 Tax=Actinomadura parmotrematis TaxID=2864039 RepID=UPI0027E28075|nr:CHASE3 domain-containing protein [Actinomadura parmotrematis]
MSSNSAPARRLTVRAWFVLALLAMGVMVVAFAVVGNSLLHRTSQVSDRLVDQIAPARIASYQMQAALLDQETGIRGYAITGDRSFLEPYEQGRRDEKAAADELLGYAGDHGETGRDVAATRAAADAWRRQYADAVIATVAKDGEDSVPTGLNDQGKRDFDALRAKWSVQDAHLSAWRTESRKDLVHTRTVRNWVFAGMLAAFLATGVLLAVLLQFTVGRPLNALRRDSRRVADGDFGHSIAPSGPADVRDLASDVENMRHKIVVALTQAERREELLRSQAAELDSQAAELRRSNTELEQFAYVASHDLQEPLRKVASFCQMLERRYADQLDDRAKQYIAFAVDGAKRMQVLINDLLAFSRVGRLDDDRERFPLDAALGKALDSLETAIEESGARIERPERMPDVVAVPTLINLLWQNLVGNAIKFRAPDRAPVIEITCVGTDEGLELAVTDNGIGIPPEFADKVFVIFQRLHTRDAYGGTGIGLALCKKIVESHGGRIWIDGDVAEGTSIRFTLPRAPEEPAAEDADTDETGTDETGDALASPATSAQGA